MKKHISLLLVACLVAFFDVQAQDKKEKERGNTDYTNNRSSAEGKKEQVEVNTDHQTPVKIIEFIPGTWMIDQVLRGEKDISESDKSNGNETITFNREGRFMSYSGNELIDSGAYRINEQHAILYMQSVNADEVSEWNVTFGEDGTMTMRLRDGSNHGERYSYIYRKTQEE